MKYVKIKLKDNSSNSSNTVILINKCSLGYHDLRVFQEGELLLGSVLLLEEIWYFLQQFWGPFMLILSLNKNQSTENAGVSFVKEANERNDFFEKNSKQ